MFESLGRVGSAAATFVVGFVVAVVVTTAAALPFGFPPFDAVTSALGAAAGVAAVTYWTADDRS